MAAPMEPIAHRAGRPSSVVIALNRADGTPLWTSKLGRAGEMGGFNGPRTTPTVDGELVFGVGMASAILIGQSVGARNLEQAKRVVGNGAAFFIVGSIAIASTGAIFTGPLLKFMQTPDDAMPFAVTYLRIIFAGIPFLFLYTF